MIVRDSTVGLFWAKVNKTDTCWLWAAAQDTKGYGQFNLEGKTTLAHRVAYGLLVAWLPSYVKLDHTCHTPLCVNPAHLRQTTHKQNQENRKGVTSRNKSGFRGVSLHSSGKWQATIKHNRYCHYLGLFETPEAANEVVKAKRLKLFTHNDVDRNKSPF